MASPLTTAMAFCASVRSAAHPPHPAGSPSNESGGLTMNDANAVTRNEQGSRTDAAARNESAQRSDTAVIPPVDVIEDSTGITLRADLPGVPKDKRSLHVEADTLTIEGEVRLAVPEGMEASYAEVSVPRF